MPIVSVTSPTSLPPSGTASGDLSGTYPGPTVAKVNGIAVSGTPSAGDVPTASSASTAVWGRGGGAQTALAARGLVAESHSLSEYVSADVLAGLGIRGSLVGLAAGTVCTGVAFNIYQVGSGTTPDHFFVGLYNTAGNLLASSADSASSAVLTAAAGVKSLPFTAPFTILTTGGYYAVIEQVTQFGTQSLQVVQNTNAGGHSTALGANAALFVRASAANALPNPAAFSGDDYAVWLALY